MAPLRFPPGRAGRAWLLERSAVAGSALSLLDGKRVLLEAELRRLRAHHDRTAQDWAATCAAAREWQARAALFGGSGALIAAASPRYAEVTVHTETLAGVSYPGRIDYVPPQQDRNPVAYSASLVHARAAHCRALAAAAEHAAVIAAVRAVERELAATRIRARALRRRRIPALRAALARLDLELEERERDERIPARRARR